ncbi:tripartite motif-containing protein 3-like isoform X2 [Anneissia japonica]|uniref:tripartite motif-containing protein 3-like isoform X2 n=1 Tax=Anneissia japonica TaxID=1529436 RepID=UPI0014255C8E|nr:tripartite motif-containing protein 3-like isoform X2 [Anneissia japonica]
MDYFEVNVKIRQVASFWKIYPVLRVMVFFILFIEESMILRWLCFKRKLLLFIVMISEEGNTEASIRVSLMLLLDCCSCLSHQRIQRTLPCQHTVCNKCIERSRRTGILTCAECGTLHKIPKEWTRLFPINLQLQRIAQCSDMYMSRSAVAEKREDESVVISGGGGEDAANLEETPIVTLRERLKVLETSEGVYRDICKRINEDINRLVQSGEKVKSTVRERIQELRRLIEYRETILFDEIKTTIDQETEILSTKLREFQKEVIAIRAFCVDARDRIASEGSLNLDEFLIKSSKWMDVFRQAKTSRSRVPKEIVFIDRSAPKKRLKANINTYGKLTIESAMTRDDISTEDVISEDSTPASTPTEELDELRQSTFLPRTRQKDKLSKLENSKEIRIELGNRSRVYLEVPKAKLLSAGNGHFRHHSIDSGIEEFTFGGSSADRRFHVGESKEPHHDTSSGARRKSRPIRQQAISPIDYSKSRIKLTVGGFGKERNCFNVPKGLTAVKDDIFAVADCGNNAVKMFDSSAGRVVDIINCEDIMKFSLPSVVDVCTFQNTSLLISISRMGSILHYSRRGKFLNRFNVSTAETSSPDIWGIASDSHDNIYICDRANGCVLHFDKEMQKVRDMRSYTKRSCPFYVAVGPDNRIYTTDSTSNTILIFTPDGRKYEEINCEKPPLGFPKFRALAGLAFDTSGRLLLVDRGEAKIIVMEPRMGNKYIGVVGSDSHAFNVGKPEGVAVLQNGTVVVSETSHHRALIF